MVDRRTTPRGRIIGAWGLALALAAVGAHRVGSPVVAPGHALARLDPTAHSPTTSPERTPSSVPPPIPTPPPATSTPPTTTSPTTTWPDSLAGTLRLVRTIDGPISPKSVAATPTGLVFAHNMMYRHTITVYDPAGELLATIPDSVPGTMLGRPDLIGPIRGAPVEGAAAPDGRAVYVSNYAMYGPSFGPEGTDLCRPGQYDDSFVYRVDVATLRIDRAYPVGAVPKYVAVSPDGHHLVVANWCSYDLTIIDLTDHTAPWRVPLAAYPRGIAITRDSGVAYVAVMGSFHLARVELGTGAVTWIRNVGNSPRHVLLSPDDRYLFVTLSQGDAVVKVDAGTGEVVATARVGPTPRSMAMSSDGRAIYVVNYDGDTMVKLATLDLTVRQTVATDADPIGITVNDRTGEVWVACYSGHIQIFADR